MMASDKPESHQLLQDGIRAAQSGDPQLAQELLLRAVEQDEQNELAWLWLSEVLDEAQEKVTALENVLALNPANAKAEERLARLKRELEARPSSPASASVRPPAAVPGPSWKDLLPQVPPEPEDSVDDPLQCAYCGRLTRLEDRACSHCGQKLYRRVQRSENSEFLRLLLLAMGITLGIGLVETVGPLLRFGGGPAGDPSIEFLLKVPGVELFFGNFLRLSTGMAQTLMFFYLLRAGLLCILLVGLGQRWAVAYYGSLVAMLGDIFWTIYLLLSGALGLVGCLVNGLFAVAILGLLFAVDREFAVNEERILTQPDTTARSALDFYKRGHHYRKLGMWALAVAQWGKAVGLAPREPLYYKDLGIGYARLKRFDRSLRVLEEAGRQAPQDKDIAEIVTLVREQAARHSGPSTPSIWL